MIVITMMIGGSNVNSTGHRADISGQNNEGTLWCSTLVVS